MVSSIGVTAMSVSRLYDRGNLRFSRGNKESSASV